MADTKPEPPFDLRALGDGELIREQSDAHTCHWAGCTTKVPPKLWGCKTHWFKLPKSLRDQVWATYRPGQEITKTPSALYIGVAQRVQAWIKENHPHG